MPVGLEKDMLYRYITTSSPESAIFYLSLTKIMLRTKTPPATPPPLSRLPPSRGGRYLFPLVAYKNHYRDAQNCHTPPLCFLQGNIGEVARSAGGVEK